ncbi:MAP10 protein, partial [Amia calva]|nr:MAP10 protein [Amia calva]
METLFSFEVVVEYIRMDAIHKAGVRPAVGLRLLDFPTLLIYRSDQGRDLLEDPESEKENITYERCHPPGGRSAEFTFKKGKSCLFKMKMDVLHTHLSNTPLYAMVLDLSNAVPKLLGSSLISLAKTADRIKADVEQYGISTPSAQGERGVFVVSNLMGERVGCISLGFKFFSLGASLMAHIPESRLLKTGSEQVKGHTTVKPSNNSAEGDKTGSGDVCMLPQITPDDPCSVLLQKIEIEGQQTEIEPDINKTNVKSAETQTEGGERKQMRRTETHEKNVGFDNATDTAIFCPPPLYYRHSEREQERNSDRYRPISVGNEDLGVDYLCSEEDESMEERNQPTKDRTFKTPGGKSESSSAALEKHTAPAAALGDALRQLPLLNALLVELSLLSSQPQQPPLSIHPHLAWLYRSVEDGIHREPQNARSRSKAYAASASRTPTSVRRTPSPGRQLQASQVKSAASLPECPTETGKSQRKSIKQGKPVKKVQSPTPPRKLLYGLTNTLRLRLKQTNPDMLIRQERQEEFRKKRAELLKGKGKKGFVAKEKHTPNVTHVQSNSHGLAASKTLDSHVRPLINSLELDSPQIENSVTRLGNEQEGMINWVGPHSRTPSPRGIVSAAVPKGSKQPTPVFPQRDLQVRIPRVLRQGSDRSSEEVDTGETSFPPLSLSKPGFQSTSLDDDMSPGSSRFSSPVQNYSDDFIDSPEPCEYLEDFTSPEPTHYNISPDPAFPSPRKGFSHEDSRTRSSSLTSQRLPLPLPVQADTSPTPALRGTHIRHHREPSVTSVTPVDSEFALDDPKQPRNERSPSVLKRGSKEEFDTERQSEPSQDSHSIRTYLMSPGSPNSTSDLGFSRDDVKTLNDQEDEERDELGSLAFENKYHHISELVMNKLPGYTL